MIKTIKWIVVEGKKLWITLWFPTANIKISKWEVDNWTYKVNIVIDEKIYHWAWHANNDISIFEVHIFDLDENLYWKEIEIILIEKIRENKKFENLEELKKQIKDDIIKIKNTNNYGLTFWSFDLVHKWHFYFLNESKKYSDKLVTIVATDKNIEKFKWNKPMFNLKERIRHIKEIWISDIVSAWDEESPLKWIELYMPNVICLWYDQVWFSNELQKYIKDNNLDIEIIRIKPFKEDIYKSSKIKETL